MKCACEKCECNELGYCCADEIRLDENGVCESLIYRIEEGDDDG